MKKKQMLAEILESNDIILNIIREKHWTNENNLKTLISQGVADGLNLLGWSPDVPNESNDLKWSIYSHEVQSITQVILKRLEK